MSTDASTEIESDVPASSPTGLTDRAMHGLAWTMGANLVQAVLQLAVVAVLARLIDPRDFGLLASAMVVIGVAQLVSEFGISAGVVQSPTLTTRFERAAFSISVLLGLGATAALLLAAYPAEALFRMEGLAPVIQVLAIAYLLKAIAAVPEGLLQRRLQLRRLALIQISAYVVGYAAVGISAAASGMGVFALVLAQLGRAGIEAAAVIALAPHARRPLFGPESRDVLRYGGGLTAAKIANYVALQGDFFVVGRGLGPTALGLYHRAYQLMAMPATFYGKAVDKAIFPAMSMVQAEKGRLLQACRRGEAVTALLAIPTGVFVFVLAPEIVHTLLGPDWIRAIPPLQVLALTLYFRVGYKVNGSMIRALGAVNALAWRQLVYAILVVGGAWLALPYGITGVAAAVSFAVIVQYVMLARLSASLLDAPWRDMFPALIPASLLAGLVALVALPLVPVLRRFDLPPFAILAIAGAASAGSALVAARRFPDRFLGEHGAWWLDRLSRKRKQGAAGALDAEQPSR